jgi:hypothetical protein
MHTSDHPISLKSVISSFGPPAEPMVPPNKDSVMFSYGKRTRLLIALAAVMGCAAVSFYGEISDAQVQQPSGDQSAQMAEGWPGQIRAYKAFAEMLSSEDIGARQDPDHAQRHRLDFHDILGLTQDEVGTLWSTMLDANQRCNELDSEFYARYPRVPPMQAADSAENRPELSAEEIVNEATKKRTAFKDLNTNKNLLIRNAIEELMTQLGNDDFHRLDAWVREHFVSTQPVHHHQPQRR